MRKPIIGIISRKQKILDHISNDGSIVTYDCINAILNSGGTPISIVTNEEYMDFDKNVLDLCDGLLFPGGYEVKPCHKDIMEYALSKHIPILGICLGFQLLCMACSADRIMSAIKDTNIEHNEEIRVVDDFKNITHTVDLNRNSFLASILGSKVAVNSRHSYTISRVESPLHIVGYSEDGLIEAVEHDDPNYFCLGVQWHPENMDNMKILFDKFIEAADKYYSFK